MENYYICEYADTCSKAKSENCRFVPERSQTFLDDLCNGCFYPECGIQCSEKRDSVMLKKVEKQFISIW